MTKLTIGQMARLFGITTKTLRHYETVGLFAPAEINPDNQYRYYVPGQIATLRSILFLRELDVGLETIRELARGGTLSDRDRLGLVLREHADRIRSSIDSQTALLRRIDRELGRWAADASGGIEVKANIVTLDAFHAVGVAAHQADGSMEFGRLWDVLIPMEGRIPHRSENNVSYGLCYDFDGERFSYMAAVRVDSFEEVPEGLEAKLVPAQTYAVFTHRGPIAGLQDTYERIHETWLAANGLRLAEGIDFERYDERFRGPMNDDSELDLYIPIRDPDRS
ncbi:MAG TPA: GyrI-like domain-containing protein [Paenibacillus sp.]|nr:GyrI-like domain-containing protein [Paenibacillus sp.]